MDNLNRTLVVNIEKQVFYIGARNPRFCIIASLHVSLCHDKFIKTLICKVILSVNLILIMFFMIGSWFLYILQLQIALYFLKQQPMIWALLLLLFFLLNLFARIYIF